MNFTSEINAFNDINKLFDCLRVEKFIKTDRSSVKILKDETKLSIRILAKDITALRAAQNSIMKLLIVFEKMKKI
jgi:tRNA threonylcarbamoyladenosine modification (KEOPS) complex  Pcc1 subunit